MQPRTKPKNRHSAAMEVIGAQLALFRINAGLTQRSLGERTTASEETIASIEQGRRALMPHLADRVRPAPEHGRGAGGGGGEAAAEGEVPDLGGGVHRP